MAIELAEHDILVNAVAPGPTKTRDDQQEKFQYEDSFQLEKPIKDLISKDISNTSEYYQGNNYEK